MFTVILVHSLYRFKTKLPLNTYAKTLSLAARLSCLFAFEAIATGTAFRITAARIAHVDFSQRAVIPRAVILTFRNPAADACVHFLYVFIHHNKKTSFFGTNSMGKFAKDY